MFPRGRSREGLRGPFAIPHSSVCRRFPGSGPIDRPTIAKRIREFLQNEYAGQGNTLTDTTHLLDDFFVDSFGVIETVMFLEKTFGIRLARVDINGDNFKNVESLSEFVSQRLSD